MPERHRLRRLPQSIALGSSLAQPPAESTGPVMLFPVRWCRWRVIVVKVVAPRFDLDECNSEREREFIELLHSRAEAGGWYADSWPRDDRIIITVDICDPSRNCVLQMLRIDFDGSGLALGPDETCQLVTDLDPARRGVVVLRDRPVAELAAAAADWLEREMSRPIVRLEWVRPGFTRTQWVLADTREGLVESDSANAARREALGPPDRTIPVLPAREPAGGTR
jgi:hypothetical protein